MKLSIYTLVFLLTFTISFDAFCQENNTCHEEDYIALRALYLSTDGDNWDDNTGWLNAFEFEANPTPPADTDINTWHGVTTNGGGCVIKLELVSNELIGNIPFELGNLSSLEYLYLQLNQLSGSIPPELGNLNSLRSLWLHHNQLSGSIPTELENLSTLEQLGLTNNQLSGNIPAELSNLSDLLELSLSNNELSGSIPVELANLGNLEKLSLYSNQLSGSIPSQLGSLSNLQYIGLNNNQLSGNIPPEFGNLNNLAFLYLYFNQLSGCYDVALMSLCTQGTSDNSISNGNNFDATWENFCAIGVEACTVNIDNTHQSTFTVYPNPAKDVVIFDVPNIAAADDIILYDITGREISRQAFPQDKQLAVSHLNDGVYIYRIFYADEVYSGKIVVE